MDEQVDAAGHTSAAMNGRTHEAQDCWCSHESAAHYGRDAQEKHLIFDCEACDPAPRVDALQLQSVSDDRRRHERLRLPKPVRTSLGVTAAHVADVSMAGVGVLHHQDAQLVGSRHSVMFHSDFGPIRLECEVVRTAPDQLHASDETACQSGLRIVHTDPASAIALRKLLNALAAELAKNDH